MAATIAVPAIIGNGMSPAAALFGAGAGTLIYLLFTKFKSPVFLGSSFAFLGSMGAAFAGAATVELGYLGLILGAIFAGLVYVVISLVVKYAGTGWINKIMPPQVIGPTVAIIGLSLAGNAVGDVLKFAIDVENTSTVAVQYRVELSTADTTNKLWNALEITIDNAVTKESGSIAEWKSTWSAFDSTNKATVNVKVELPSYIGNDLQTAGADLTVKVYAVQSNGTELV